MIQSFDFGHCVFSYTVYHLFWRNTSEIGVTLGILSEAQLWRSIQM